MRTKIEFRQQGRMRIATVGDFTLSVFPAANRGQWNAIVRAGDAQIRSSFQHESLEVAEHWCIDELTAIVSAASTIVLGTTLPPSLLAAIPTDALVAELRRRGLCTVEPEYIADVAAMRAGGALHLAGPTGSVLEEVAAERARQDAKWGQMNYPSVALVNGAVLRNCCISGSQEARTECDGRHRRGDGSFMDVLIEETAEANDAACDREKDKLRLELVQVAAVAVAFIECIDRQAPARSSK